MRQKGGRSKRDRKHRETQSLKHKHNESGLETLPDADLARLLEDSNALILPAKGAATAAGAGGEAAAAGAEEAPPEKQLSKSQLRKLRKIQEEKEKRAKRADVLQTLAQHQLKQEELQLLRPVAQRGQRETKKQALKRALQLQRAGVSLPSDVRLLQERERPAAAMGEGGDASSDGSGSDSEEEEEQQQRVQQQQPRPSARRLDDSGSESEEEEEGAAHAAKRQRTAGAAQQAAQQEAQQPPKAAAAAGKLSVQQAEQQAAAAAAAAAEQKRQAALAIRQAAEAAKAQLGVDEARDDEFTAQQAQRAGQGMPAGPGGQPRVVMVQRRPEIQAVREGLPITGMEQEIMEAVLTHDVVVLCGETGCGKTTQVPQFLHEAGFGCRLFPERAGAVGVTQPRRVAAISTAERVADELDSKLGAVVGYQVRYDKRVGENTAIKFMTDGILLREVQEDFLLRRYSAILVDEAHERSLNTDILCGMLSRIVALRRSLADSTGSSSGGGGEDKVYPLKLIIMSATLRTDDFVQNQRLFPVPPPVVCVPARQYPVTVHFSKRTELHDYVGAAFKKVSQIHRTLPPGGVLVFLTGQREVENLCRKLRATFNRPPRRKPGPGAAGSGGAANGSEGAAGGAGSAATADDVADAAAAAAAAEEAAGVDAFSGDAAEVDVAGGGEDAALLDALLEDDRMGGEGAHDDFDDESSGDEEEVVVMGGEGFTPEQIKEAEADFERRLGISLTALKAPNGGGEEEQERAVGPVHVLPLYAMLPPAQQARVFRPPPPGHRLIVVATNVAETSLTIPGIRYVVDAGRSKQRLLESAAGLSRFEVRWVSKASAEQRAGRAGRTGPGHCYRLFSSAHYNDTFPQHSPPEIINTALEGVVLQMKALGVDRVANFPFPTPPEREALQAAERCLVALSALDGGSGQLTALGRAMAAYPISPRHARMLMEVALQEQQAQQAQQGGAAAAAGAAGAAAGAAAAATAGGSSSRLRQVLPYAVALAAVLSVDSPFVHVDSIAAGGEDEGKAAAAAAAAADEQGEQGADEPEGGEEGQAGATRKAEKAAEKEAAKRKRQAARQAHAQFRVADSDALSALRALCAFEAAGEDEAFCRRNFLHFRNLREAAALHKQLARQLEAQGARQRGSAAGSAAAAPALALAAGGAAGPLPPPAPVVMEQLRRALAAGWADQVARRIRSIDYLRAQEQQGKKSRAVRYSAAAGLDEDVFLHPNSTLHSTAPEFVVYAELIRTAKRPYMAGVTSIEPQWLPDVAAPLCTFSQPLAEPAPFYKPAADKVLCWRDVTFGRHDWALPRCAAAHPDATERCAVFAAALLEGRVLPSFAGLRGGLAVPPSMLLRPEMRVHKRASDLLAALTAARVDSRAALAAKWAQSPGFLRHELSQCMQKGCGGALLQAWEALRAEADAPQPAADAAPGKKKKKLKR